MQKVLTPDDMRPRMKIRFTDEYIKRSVDDAVNDDIVEIKGVTYSSSNEYRIVYAQGDEDYMVRYIDKFGKGVNSNVPMFCLPVLVKSNDGRGTCAWCGGSIKKVLGFNITTTYDVCEDCGK